MDDQLPPEAAKIARTVIEQLRLQLQPLFPSLKEDANSAVRFSAGEEN